MVYDDHLSINVTGLDMTGKSTTVSEFVKRWPAARVTTHRGLVSTSLLSRSLEHLAAVASQRFNRRGLLIMNISYLLLFLLEKYPFRSFTKRKGAHVFEGRWERSVAFNLARRNRMVNWGKLYESILPIADSKEISVFLQCTQQQMRNRAAKRDVPSLADTWIAENPIFAQKMRFELLRVTVRRAPVIIEFDTGATPTTEVITQTFNLMRKIDLLH